MMPIKFRAWDKANKRIIPVDMLDLKNGGIYSWVNNNHRDGYFDQDYILMQFTGLLDKNGKEIYERDIVKNKSDLGKVFWHDTRAMFLVDNSFSDVAPMDEWDDFEVIGNIYENSKLLKVKAKDFKK